MAQGQGLGPEVTVACVYRTGGDYTDEYVHRLRDGVAQHFKAPHKFVCLSNKKAISGVNVIPLEKGWPGWWSKLELFSHRFERLVYLDLDTVLIRDVTDIFSKPYPFAALGDLKWRDEHGPVLGSGYLAMDGTDRSYICDAFTPDRIREYQQPPRKWGDQGFIQDHLREPFVKIQEEFPGRFAHFKTHIRQPDKSIGHAPAGASIVYFSGQPRPHKINWSIPL